MPADGIVVITGGAGGMGVACARAMADRGPILLADYDVDGYEVWNPQSWEYTDFLITVLNRKNREAGPSTKRLLVFMGDDTHMSEKTRSPHDRDHFKASREIGVQPPWSDQAIRKKLVVAHMDKHDVIEEYKARLAG